MGTRVLGWALGCQEKNNLRTNSETEQSLRPTYPNGLGPVQWIAAKHTRRDLDASQRAAAALALLPLLEKEAKDRQLSTLKKGDQHPDRAILPERGKAREFAAGLTGASDGYVRDAKRIVEKDSSMLERMRDGEITIQEAKRPQKWRSTETLRLQMSLIQVEVWLSTFET